MSEHYHVSMSVVIDTTLSGGPRDAVVRAFDAIVKRDQIIDVEVKLTRDTTEDVIAIIPFTIPPVESIRTTAKQEQAVIG